MSVALRALRQIGPSLIVAAAACIIAFVWYGAYSAVVAHRAASLERIETSIESKADLLAEELHRDLLVTDQSLHILEVAWQSNPWKFDFDMWRQQVLALTGLSMQIFLVDQSGVIRRSSRSALIGTYLGDRDYFRHFAELAHDDERMFIGSLVQGKVTRVWQINMARRLDYPDGTFGGIINASIDVSTFFRLSQELSLGPRDFLVVAAADGTVQGVGNPQLLATPLTIAGSRVFAAMQHSAAGVWSGPSPLDHVNRIMAFATIPRYGLKVLVGFDRREALAGAVAWDRSALGFAAIVTLLIAITGGVILWADREARKRHANLMRERSALALANLQLEATENQARTKALQLEATLAGMTDGVMMIGPDLRLLAWNTHFPEFTGVPAEILRKGLPMEDMLRAQAIAGEFGEVDVETEVSRRMRRLRQGIGIGVTERRRPNGRTLEIRRSTLAEGGFVTLYSDITDRRSAEERARRAETMAAIGRLTAGLAHDFNNLLATVSGNAEMLQREFPEASRGYRRASTLLEAASRGAALVRQLLAFGRKQTLAPKALNVNDVLHGLSELLRSTVGSKVALEVRQDANLWPALIDPGQIDHVILNLAMNARDAMPDGGRLILATGNISLSSSAEDLPGGDYVVLTVSDTGSGMADEVLARAFEPFFTTKPVGRGSGLGLSQVYGIVRQSGGSVRIESNPGAGTAVTVYLPRFMELGTGTDEPLLTGEAHSTVQHVAV
jgi:signal transduction histidine kinase